MLASIPDLCTLTYLYINGIPEGNNSIIRLFEDDTKLFEPVGSDIESEEIQSDISHVSSWSIKWLLPFNIDKCETLHTGFNYPETDYLMEVSDPQGRKTILTVTQEKDLGVTFDKGLKFRPT